MCVLLFLFSVPAMDDELVTETPLSILPEAIPKNTDMLPSCGKMSAGVGGDQRTGRCVHVFLCVYTCYMRKSVPQQCSLSVYFHFWYAHCQTNVLIDLLYCTVTNFICYSN